MQRLEVSSAVRPIYGSLGVKRLSKILSLGLFCDCEVLLCVLKTEGSNAFKRFCGDYIRCSVWKVFSCSMQTSASNGDFDRVFKA